LALEIIQNLFIQLFLYVQANFQSVALFVLILILIFDRKQFKLNIDGIAKFAGLMILISFLRMSLMDLSGGVKQSTLQVMQRMSLGGFITVGLEDVFFAMIPLYLSKFIRSNLIMFFVWVLFNAT
jgi:hypothetical protein